MVNFSLTHLSCIVLQNHIYALQQRNNQAVTLVPSESILYVKSWDWERVALKSTVWEVFQEERYFCRMNNKTPCGQEVLLKRTLKYSQTMPNKSFIVLHCHVLFFYDVSSLSRISSLNLFSKECFHILPAPNSPNNHIFLPLSLTLAVLWGRADCGERWWETCWQVVKDMFVFFGRLFLN